ncbi:SID1 transmembrane family member 2-like isoform X2 [Mobula birostris]|uniref:SID1 transmembrane family member 2-like isoform X2 n=1 Tax=Mobula birostris TaxID=1983395 RepID=UPI003B289FD9
MGLGNRTKILNVTVVPAVNLAYVNGVLFSLGIFLAFYLLTLLIACWEHRRYQRKYIYQDVSRTLCQPEVKSESKMQYFYVDVSTLSEKNASVQLYVKRIQHFVLRTAEPFRFNATPSQPQYFRYKFSDGEESVIVKVSSDSAFPCSVVSIQDVLCPVNDLDNNVAFSGTYQTMTKKAAITVQGTGASGLTPPGSGTIITPQPTGS